MPNLSDEIENYIKEILAQDSFIKFQRNKIAREFNCVPSQINYVLKTRFSLENGYIVESQRGGGGYIKIKKIEYESKDDLLKKILKQIGKSISQPNSYSILNKLYEEEVITLREKEILENMFHRRNLSVSLPNRDLLRAKIFRSALKAIIKLRD